MCRCLEYETNTRKLEMTATLRSKKTDSSTEFTPTPSGANQCATIWEAKAQGDAIAS